jgi:homoserine kinase type II
MAVYTEVAPSTASYALHAWRAGELRSLVGASGGIENTNYFVESSEGSWVLTVFERLDFSQAPFYLALMRHLARHGLPVPEPRTVADGGFLQSIHGKPASLVTKLPGASVDAPDLRHCERLGETLARLHQAAADFPLQQPNLRGMAWWEQTVPVVTPYLAEPLAARLQDELAFQRHVHAAPATQALPQAAVHADLFRDNALFDGPDESPVLSGVFDFYFAGTDYLAYDLAVVLNDWCIDLASGRLEEARAEALVRAYQSVRALTPAEARALPAMRRAAALRFWLSRLADWHLPRPASLLKPKDPTHFERVLADCVERPWHPPR